MEKDQKFVIIDAMALAYKAYFAFISRPLSTSKGEPTSAVYGFITQLLKIIEDTNPDYIAVAFDPAGPTFRHERYDKYKSSRAKIPDDMIPQLDRIRQAIAAFDIPVYIKEKFEADDIIGTVLQKTEAAGMLSYAITPDKDYIQLITENTKLIRPGKSTEEIVIYDKQKVIDELGFEPEFMIDYLALIGDKSDDIPGVAGIGPKTAAPLIAKYGTVENIYEHIDEIEKKGVQTKLVNDKENAFLSKELATIVKDVPIEFDIEKTKFTKPHLDKVLDLFAELEFHKLGDRLQSIFGDERLSNENIRQEAGHDTFDKSKVKYTSITESAEAQKLADQLMRSELLIFDTETNSKNAYSANLAGASFSVIPSESYFVGIAPPDEKQLLDFGGKRLGVNEFVKIFKPLFENENIKKVCQNGKYDIAVLRNYGINVKNFYFDTMLASYVLDPDAKHGMDDLSQTYLNYRPISFSEMTDSSKDPDTIYSVDAEKLCNYACEDSDITLRLFNILKQKLKDENVEKVAYEVEFPLVEVLEDMERTGVKINEESLLEQSKELEFELDKICGDIYRHAGGEFNINSTKQLQEILFDKLKLKPTKKTKTGYSTDARSLQSLFGEHEIIECLLGYRQYSKLKSTYVDALPKLINPVTGRIHTTYNQTVAATGRLSSIDPNLQNIPIRSEFGRRIREAFIPSKEGNLILSADYSQVELRIMASICKDEALINAFRNNEDIHRATAAHVFRVNPEDVTADMRRKAKEVNFGILYGIGPFGLKTRLGITQTHAKEIIDTYFNTFKNVKGYIDSSIESAHEKGYAETLLGRRRFLKNINSKNRVVRSAEERIAINMPIQGTAADVIKLAMINIYRELNKGGFKTKMVLQVHDELVFDVPEEELMDVKTLVHDLMENALPLEVPLKVESGAALNWLEAH